MPDAGTTDRGSVIDEIAKELGDDVPLTVVLQKAAERGIARLLRKGMAADKDDEGSGDDDKDDDTTEEEPEGGDGGGSDGGGAGYDDMNKGRDGGDTIDATEFMQDVAAQLVAIRKGQDTLLQENAALRKDNEALRKAVAERDTALRADIAAALEPLNKAVLDTHGKLGELDKLVQQGSQVTPSELRARAAALRKGTEGTVAGATRPAPNAADPDANGITRGQLAKAMQKRVIGEHELSYYGAHGEFPADNEAKIKAVKAA